MKVHSPLTLWLVSCMTVLVVTAAARAQEDPPTPEPTIHRYVQVVVKDGTEATVTGVGYGVFERAYLLKIHLIAPDGWKISKSECRDNTGEVLWEPEPAGSDLLLAVEHDWKCVGATPSFGGTNKKSHSAIFVGDLVPPAGGNNGGNAPPPTFEVRVCDVDMDADTDNDSTLEFREPSTDETEDDNEYPLVDYPRSGLPENPDVIPGVIIPLNDDHDEYLPEEEGVWGIDKDYHDANAFRKEWDTACEDNDQTGNFPAMVRLCLNSRKNGNLKFTIPNTIRMFDPNTLQKIDGTTAYRPGITADGAPWTRDFYIEGIDTGSCQDLFAQFTPDAPVVGEADDTIRVTVVKLDLDVDSNNNGNEDYDAPEDLVENKPSETGLLVPIDATPNEVPPDPPIANLKKGKIHKLGDEWAKVEEANYTPKIQLFKVAGEGDVRVYDVAANLLLDTTVPGPSADLYAAVKQNDIDLRFMGLTEGEVIVGLRAVLDFGDHVIVLFVDKIKINGGLDLDIDSDNNNGSNAPARTKDEDKIEDDAAKPGKMLAVNDDNDDSDVPDSICDFADGFDLDPAAGKGEDDQNAAEDDFRKVVLEVGRSLDPTVATIRFTYSASDPAACTADAPPADTHLRIWKTLHAGGGGPSRKKAAVTANGDYVPSDAGAPIEFTLDKLGFAGGANPVTKVEMYVEAVATVLANAAQNKGRILVEVDPDGPGPLGFILKDAIRVTSYRMDIDIDSDNNNQFSSPDCSPAEDKIEDVGGTPGKFIATNVNTDDNDDVLDLNDGFDADGIANNEDDANPAEADFVPMILTIENHVDPTKAKVKFRYDAAGLNNPVNAQRVRVWTKMKDAAGKRDKRSVPNGDFVPADVWLDWSSLPNADTNSRVKRIYAETVGISGAVGGEKIAVTLAPDGVVETVKDTVRVTAISVDLDVDTNRNNAVADNDERGEDGSSKDRGAIACANYDDDDADGHQDAVELTLNNGLLVATNEDTDIDAGDLNDIARLLVKQAGPKNGLQYFFRMNGRQLKAIHIFGTRAVAGTNLWGGWADHAEKLDNGVFDFDVTAQVSDTADVEMGVESLFLAGQKLAQPGAQAENYTFDGQFDLELVAQATVGQQHIVPQNIVAIDKVRLRVAPYVLIDNTRNAEAVYMSASAVANSIAVACGALAVRPPNPVPAYSTWFQDSCQTGYTSTPAGGRMHLMMEVAHGGAGWIRNQLAGNVGTFMRNRSYDMDSGEFGGNLEVAPPSPAWPSGRALVGDIMSDYQTDFIAAQKGYGDQGIQQPVEVVVAWLAVGHADEIVTSVPSNQAKGYKYGIASPTYGEALLRNGDAGRGIAKPAASAALFATGQTDHGTATNDPAFAPTDTGWLFDGAAHGRIGCIAGANHVDGETVTISDGAAVVVYEYDNNGVVGAGNRAVDINPPAGGGAATATVMRDRLKAAIVAAAMALTLEDDGTDALILINNAIGLAGNVAIAETVANPGYVFSGMAGGAAAGRDFRNVVGPPARAWTRIRIYDGTGHGQVATIVAAKKGVGWCQIEGAYDTTSTIAHTLGNAANTSLWGLLKDDTTEIANDTKWLTDPDNTSLYIITEGTKEWAHWYTVGGVNRVEYVGALLSVQEVLADATLWLLNGKAQQHCTDAKTVLIQSMGAPAGGGGTYLVTDNDTTDDQLNGDANDDFMAIPGVFFGQYNPAGAGTITLRTAEAFVPGAVNLKPVTRAPAQLFVVAEQFTPGFQTAITAVLGVGAVYADDWDGFHRLMGEVHCATAARREMPTAEWWTLQP